MTLAAMQTQTQVQKMAALPYTTLTAIRVQKDAMAAQMDVPVAMSLVLFSKLSPRAALIAHHVAYQGTTIYAAMSALSADTAGKPARHPPLGFSGCRVNPGAGYARQMASNCFTHAPAQASVTPGCSPARHPRVTH